jgi:hypothetical protein
MFSPSTIADLQLEAAAQAAHQHKQPLVVWAAEEITEAPNLGTYTPAGWRPLLWADIDQDGQGHGEHGDERVLLFVDLSGWGDEDEPALSQRQLVAKVEAIQTVGAAKRLTIGWGIYEVGQFQGHLAAYLRTDPLKRLVKSA